MSTLEKIIGLKQETLDNSITLERLGDILEEKLNTFTTHSHSNSGINFKNGDLYLHDGIYPNKKGMELMSNFVENSFKDFYE